MRLHISLEDELVAQVDDAAGPRGRSEFIAAAVRQVLERRRRWQDFEAAVGSVPDEGHEWDDDAAGWVRAQRRSDPRRLG